MVNNRVKIEGLSDFCRTGEGRLKLWISANPKSLDVLYFGRDTNRELTATGHSPQGIAIVRDSNDILLCSYNSKTINTCISTKTYKDGIPFPGSPVDYIKTVTITLGDAHPANVEFTVYVR
jgi:hypothetical protein